MQLKGGGDDHGDDGDQCLENSQSNPNPCSIPSQNPYQTMHSLEPEYITNQTKPHSNKHTQIHQPYHTPLPTPNRHPFQVNHAKNPNTIHTTLQTLVHNSATTTPTTDLGCRLPPAPHFAFAFHFPPLYPPPDSSSSPSLGISILGAALARPCPAQPPHFPWLFLRPWWCPSGDRCPSLGLGPLPFTLTPPPEGADPLPERPRVWLLPSRKCDLEKPRGRVYSS
jgi:hypothetical protein